MLPRWHILLGAIFTTVIWIAAPQINLINLALIFLSSFLIDFDHYLASLIKTKKWKLSDSFRYHKKQLAKENKEIARGLKRKGDFHLFHTIEFHILIGIMGIFFRPFLYIFMGMMFHTLLDIIYLAKTGKFHRREFILSNWLGSKF